LYENVKDEIVLTNPFDGKARRAKGPQPNELDLGVSMACQVGFAIVLQKETKKRKKVHCCCFRHSPHHFSYASKFTW
jgi:hypothetical protein